VFAVDAPTSVDIRRVNDENAKRSKPFYGRTTYQDGFADPMGADAFKVNGLHARNRLRSEARVDNCTASAR